MAYSPDYTGFNRAIMAALGFAPDAPVETITIKVEAASLPRCEVPMVIMDQSQLDALADAIRRGREDRTVMVTINGRLIEPDTREGVGPTPFERALEVASAALGRDYRYGDRPV